MTVQELREKRNGVLATLRAIVDRAERDNRPLNDAEEHEYRGHEQELQDLTGRIERAQFVETEERVARAGRYEVPESQRSAGEAQISAEERREAFRTFLTRGETRALTTAPDSAGGYLVPDEVSAQIIQAAQEAQVLAPRAMAIATMAGTLSLPVATHGAAAWIAEGSDESESDESFAAVTLTPYKVKTAMAVSDEMLQDAAQLESYIVTEFARRIAEKEEAAFIDGNGSNQPTGLLTGAATGKTTAGASAITFDEVLDLYSSLKAAYLPRASFVMHPATVAYLMKIKTGVASDNRFIWTASLSADAPGMLLGRPVYLSSHMPTIATTKKTIAFGDLSYYVIARRPTFALQRDPYSQAKAGKVVFRLFRRVDGKLSLSEAVKVLVQA